MLLQGFLRLLGVSLSVRFLTAGAWQGLGRATALARASNVHATSLETSVASTPASRSSLDQDCDMSDWSEWSDCEYVPYQAVRAGLQKRERQILRRRSPDCPCTVQVLACGEPGSFKGLLEEIEYRRTTAPAPYSIAGTTSTLVPTLRPLTAEEVQLGRKPPEECGVTEWSEWSSCRHRRSAYRVKAALQTRGRQIAHGAEFGGCPPLEETRPCLDSGPIPKIIYDLS
mmetsp:Transcript_82854/g.192518  ORF Transcript_82854/g.192518 Transcript_82854/m.192518 type:complete len:228 (-) Transcript_82854:108-791(-)